MKKPMTTEELFHKIRELLKDKGKLPDIADVHPVDENGKRISWGYSCASMEAALRRKEELLKKYPQVVVRDNATRKEKIFSRRLPVNNSAENIL